MIQIKNIAYILPKKAYRQNIDKLKKAVFPKK
jgi:hypothetical protein